MGHQASKTCSSPKKGSPLTPRTRGSSSDLFSTHASNGNEKDASKFRSISMDKAQFASFGIGKKLKDKQNVFHLTHRLPREILLHILSFVDASDLCHVGQVSKFFYDVSQSEILWKNLLTREFEERLNFFLPEQKVILLQKWQKEPKQSFIKETKRFWDFNLKSPKYLTEFALTNPAFQLVVSECVKR